MKIGWVEWDETIGPRGRVYADGHLLPTINAGWVHLCQNTPEGCKGHWDHYRNQSIEWTYPDTEDFEAVMALENGFYALLMAIWDHPFKDTNGSRTWSITLALLSYYDPTDRQCLKAPDAHIVTGITDDDPPVAILKEDTGYINEYMVDPEDYKDLMNYLKVWSNVIQPVIAR